MENLTYTGSADWSGTGNSLDNAITGSTGADTLNGGAGVDKLIGGAGNDIYVVDSTTDTITEATNGGTDTVQSSVNFSLANVANVENLTYTGSTAWTGAGNSLDNVITGGKGADTLTGGDGTDTLIGGAGKDTLSGEYGSDYFVFNAATGSGNIDTILDFSSEIDVIQLSKSIFKDFSAMGQLAEDVFYSAAGAVKAHDASDRVIYNSATGYLYYDADGNGIKFAAVQFATLEDHAYLSASDIWIV